MSTENKIVQYTGEALKSAVNLDKYACTFGLQTINEIKLELVYEEIDGQKVKAKEKLDPYLPDQTLREAIELMQILERPLLLRGEPGCGKTRVAQAYAYERYGKDYRRYYFEWHIKSTSKAHEGLYSFDHIARLRDAYVVQQNGKEQKELSPDDTKESLKKYRELGPLGQAFLASEPGNPAILLIDEIDKAEIDFPNDLLLELDEMRFVIKETGEEIVPKCRPLIFITSNQERELPQAFLRRCLFHFIHFPDEELLKKIMLANFPAIKESMEKSEPFVGKVVGRFNELRRQLRNNPTANKNVTTSELKDWMAILVHFYQYDATDTRIDVSGEKLPFHTALLKTENDLKSLGKFETR
jgi:MoxR-like ATPase